MRGAGLRVHAALPALSESAAVRGADTRCAHLAGRADGSARSAIIRIRIQLNAVGAAAIVACQALAAAGQALFPSLACVAASPAVADARGEILAHAAAKGQPSEALAIARVAALTEDAGDVTQAAVLETRL